jgi:hypothetical protein
MAKLSDVTEVRTALGLIDKVASEPLTEISDALDAALHGSRAAVRSYFHGYQSLVGTYLEVIHSERPDLVGPDWSIDLKVPHATGLRLSIGYQAQTAPFSSWVGIAGARHGIALAVLSHLREGLAELDPLPFPSGETRFPDLGIETWRIEIFLKAVADELAGDSPPLIRAMDVLGLSWEEAGRAFGVSRQAVAQWANGDVPAGRMGRVLTVARIADILDHRLKANRVAAIVRRRAEDYGGRSMLELIEAGEEEWLLEDLQRTFDYSTS